MKALTQSQADYYHKNGFVFPIPALTPAEVQTCIDGLNRLETELGCPVAEADVKWRSHAYAHSPWFNDLIRHPRILDAIEDVIGPDILVWTGTFFIKEPGSKTFAAWHQDGAYFGLEPKLSVCAWVALTDASRLAGCMDHIPGMGGHRILHHSPLGLKNSINRAGQTIMEPFDKSSPVTMEVPAGSFSLHSEVSIHRSPPNHADYRRIGIGLNYIPTHVKPVNGVRCKAMLVRGEDRFGHFDLVDPPRHERDEAGLATHMAISQAYRANYNEEVKRHEAMFAGS